VRVKRDAYLPAAAHGMLLSSSRVSVKLKAFVPISKSFPRDYLRGQLVVKRGTQWHLSTGRRENSSVSSAASWCSDSSGRSSPGQTRPPCWSDDSFQYEADFLHLPCLPLSSKSFYERQLFEQQLLLGHNQMQAG